MKGDLYQYRTKQRQGWTTVDRHTLFILLSNSREDPKAILKMLDETNEPITCNLGTIKKCKTSFLSDKKTSPQTQQLNEAGTEWKALKEKAKTVQLQNRRIAEIFMGLNDGKEKLDERSQEQKEHEAAHQILDDHGAPGDNRQDLPGRVCDVMTRLAQLQATQVEVVKSCEREPETDPTDEHCPDCGERVCFEGHYWCSDCDRMVEPISAEEMEKRRNLYKKEVRWLFEAGGKEYAICQFTDARVKVEKLGVEGRIYVFAWLVYGEWMISADPNNFGRTSRVAIENYLNKHGLPKR